MKLGNNSLSLAVKDIAKAKEFYIKLGFEPVKNAGSVEEKWMILQNEHTQIGLFQDMFEQNIITFNPPDARNIFNELKAKGIEPSVAKTMESENGPCHFIVTDPDGNTLLFDQFE